MSSSSHRLPGRATPAMFALAAALSLPADAFAQTFTRVHDPANPVTTDTGTIGFTGVSWIDADQNGWPDLFVGNVGLYLNAGGGVFTKQLIANNAGALGCSWADYDNDGDPDLMLAGGSTGRGSRLLRNDGPAGFTVVTAGATSDSLGNAGWSCAWGDYDADGFVDLVIAAPFGFTGTNPNRLLHNAGNGTLTQDTSTDVTVGTAPYTVATWCDSDLDGDLDLSIGAGPASGTKGVDYFYRNTRIGGGSPLLDRHLTPPLATDLRDGQIINWPDYDNDGDLDCFITNYRQANNSLYRNENGTYVRKTSFDVGPIAGDIGWNLSSCWEDFDNDGDLDCYVTRTSGFPNRYYRNQGNGTFVTVPMDSLTSAPATTTVAADYDQDGDIDLYVSSPGASKGLFRNTAPPENHWFQLRLAGTVSNRSAIGTKVRVRATIGGQLVTQIREVSAQNAFNGHNSFVQHFGLGGATFIEWMEVQWPGGLVETFANLPVDTMLTLVEGNGLPTPTLASLVRSWISTRGVELEWYGSLLEADRAYVHRRAADAPEDAWTPLGPAVTAGAHLVSYVDASAGPGDWAYRLSDGADGGAWLTDEAWVSVSGVAGAARLALSASAPVALGGRLRLTFTLPVEGDVRARVFDARGRRVAAEELGTRASGSHSVDLSGRPLVPGVYWVRLAQGDAAVTARVVVAGGR